MSEPTPAPAPAARKCVNCKAPLAEGHKHCPACGVTAEGRPKDVGMEERVARLETDTAPMTKLLDRLRKRGIDPDQIEDKHLDMVEGLKEGGGIGLLAQMRGGMSAMFPGIPFGQDDEDEPRAK